ncbi:MAG: type II toxin-antitoxin system prevent-host-death family antitoxin [Rhodanobacteraceae bacterium]
MADNASKTPGSKESDRSPKKKAGGGRGKTASVFTGAGERKTRAPDGRARTLTASALSGTSRTVTSTKAKNMFRQVIQSAKSGPVFVTSHKRREAVVLSIQAYEELLANQRDPLAEMTEHFDALVARMQTPEQRNAVARLFETTPEEMFGASKTSAKDD